MITNKKLIVRSLLIAGGLTVLKLGVYTVTASVAILASAADSFMDLLVSSANFLFLKSASKPADQEHAYGHGKIESLAGLLQSLVIAGVAVGIAYMAARRFINPEPIHQPLAGFAITVLAIVISFWHIQNLRASVQSSDSAVMSSEYVHYASDLLAYLGVLASFVLFKLTGSLFWDPLISVLIVLYLLKSTAVIFDTSLGELLDRQLPGAVLGDIDGIIRSGHPKVVDYHDLRTRRVGPTKFIEFHVVLRDVAMFHEAHDITEEIIDKILLRYPGSIVTVHSDPEGGR